MSSVDELDSILGRLCLYREGRGESLAGKAAILAVLRNRTTDSRGRWPKSIAGVVTQHAQFSSFNANDPNVTAWPSPNHPPDWLAWLDCCAVYDTPLTADPTHGANSYHSIPDAGYTYKDSRGKDVTLMPPSWADPSKFTVQIGSTKFYKL